MKNFSHMLFAALVISSLSVVIPSYAIVPMGVRPLSPEEKDLLNRIANSNTPAGPGAGSTTERMRVNSGSDGTGCVNCGVKVYDEDLKAHQGLTEVKYYLDPADYSALKPLIKNEESGNVVFRDTAQKTLHAQGIEIRFRTGADFDATVKIDGLRASDIDPALLNTEGFKCETNATAGKSAQSCSYTVDNVTALTQAQTDFLKKYRPSADISKIIAMPSIPLVGGKIDKSHNPPELMPVVDDDGKMKIAKIAVEKWTLPDGKVVLEISTKVEDNASKAAFIALDSFITNNRLHKSGTQVGKTEQAFQSF